MEARSEITSHMEHAFAAWRPVYNYRRPHEGIGLAVPGDRYTPSPRPYRDVLEPIEYAPGDIIRKVQDHGRISFRGAVWRVGRAFVGDPWHCGQRRKTASSTCTIAPIASRGST